MTQPTTGYGGQFALLVDDGTGANLVTIGAFKTKTLSVALAASTEQVPDNDSPDAVVDDSVIGTSRSTKITASGMMTTVNLPFMDTWMAAGAARAVEMRFSNPSAIAGKTYSFLGWLTKKNIGGTIQKKVTLDIEITADGPTTISTT